MKTVGISFFLVIFAGLVGTYVARELFPKVVQREVIRRVIEHGTPDIIERIQYDTTTVTKWKTRVLYKTLRPSQVIDVLHVELDTLRWAILALNRKNDKLDVDVYNVETEQLTAASYHIKNDFKLRIAQHRTTDPLIILESRNVFDIIPHIFLGYNSRYGPEIALRGQRLWKLHLDWMADSDGFHGTASVKLK